MLGLGEKAGSGFQKILRAWQEQQWFTPLVSENLDLEMTGVQMPLVSMIPETVEKELRAVVGDAYNNLDELGRMILLLTHSLGEIRNADIQGYLPHHPRDIEQRLGQLTDAGWLQKEGHGRGTRYCLCKTDLDNSQKLSSLQSPSSEHLPSSSEHLPSNSEHLVKVPEASPERTSKLKNDQEATLLEIAAPVRAAGKVDKPVMENIILALCKDDWRSLRTLTELLGRHPDTLRTHYINSMLRDGQLEARVPDTPSHPKQAYRTRQANPSCTLEPCV